MIKELPIKMNPHIRKHLLWEYDIKDFDFDASANVVIERVIERGDLADWQEIVRYYGAKKIRQIAVKSPRLDLNKKKFR